MSENWVALVEAENDIEAEIIQGMLMENGIPVRRADSSPYTGALRVIGGMAYEVVIMVPDLFVQEAKKILESFSGNA